MPLLGTEVRSDRGFGGGVKMMRRQSLVVLLCCFTVPTLVDRWGRGRELTPVGDVVEVREHALLF